MRIRFAIENIGAAISSEMRSDAITAVLLAALFMLLYIWFRFADIRFRDQRRGGSAARRPGGTGLSMQWQAVCGQQLHCLHADHRRLFHQCHHRHL